MHIGKAAELTGATRKAIRHYEAIGLIPVPGRVGKYRVYAEKDLALIGMIRRAQSVGFTLAEMKQLVAHKARYGSFPLEMADEMIQRKREYLRREASRLARQDECLKALREELHAAFPPSTCTDE
ncbi:MAG: MerR family transcriptional regulator [Pseudomonadota bacterium]